MIYFNLLPYREEQKIENRNNFYKMAGLTALSAIGIVLTVHMSISELIDVQNIRNQKIETAIKQQELKIQEIKNIKEQTQFLIARKKIVETLQNDRFSVVRLMEEFAKIAPQGLFLKSIKQTGADINIIGYAQNNNLISLFMENIGKSLWVTKPTLIEIKSLNNSTQGGLIKPNSAQTMNEFSLNLKYNLPESLDKKDKKKEKEGDK